MKILVAIVCLAALCCSVSNAYPVIRLERMPIPFKVSIPMALRVCGLNSRCLLNQDIIGIEDEDVQREYAAVIQIAFLQELTMLANQAGVGAGPFDSSEEDRHPMPELPDPETSDDDSEVPSIPRIPETEPVPEASPEIPDDSDASAVPAHQIRVITIRHPFGTRRLIFIQPVNGVENDSSDEEAKTTVAPEISKESSEEATVISEETENSATTTTDVPMAPTPPTSTPNPDYDETPTELTNSIEQKVPRISTTTESSRESIEGSDESNTDQVEVFNPAKPMRISDADRFKYEAAVPEIRQV